MLSFLTISTSTSLETYCAKELKEIIWSYGILDKRYSLFTIHNSGMQRATWPIKIFQQISSIKLYSRSNNNSLSLEKINKKGSNLTRIWNDCSFEIQHLFMPVVPPTHCPAMSFLSSGRISIFFQMTYSPGRCTEGRVHLLVQNCVHWPLSFLCNCNLQKQDSDKHIISPTETLDPIPHKTD